MDHGVDRSETLEYILPVYCLILLYHFGECIPMSFYFTLISVLHLISG